VLQNEDPGLEYCPAKQFWHVVDPGKLEYFPPSQGVQLAAAAVE